MGKQEPAGAGETSKICGVDGCDNPVKAKGWCAKHHQRWYRYGDPTHMKRDGLLIAWEKAMAQIPGGDPRCQHPDCDRLAVAKSLCYMHYAGMLRRPKPLRPTRYCSIAGCQRVHAAKGLCRKHYYQKNKVKAEEP